MLKTIQGSRSSAGLNAGKRRDRDQLPAGRLDFQVEQRIESGPILVADLRDHLVTPVVEIEPVHIGAAEQRAQLLPDTGQVESQVRQPFPIDHDPSLGQIDLEVRIDVEEFSALPTGPQHGPGGFQQLLGR